MKRLLMAGWLCAATAAPAAENEAAVVASTSRGVLVAHDSAVELFDGSGRRTIWRTEGPATPSRVVVGNTRAAVLDALENEIRIIDLATGGATRLRVGETPVDGLFLGSDLYMLERDSQSLERIGVDGSRASVTTGTDPAFLGAANRLLYVYSRVEGTLHEITTAPLAIRREIRVAPFASDLELDGRYAYLVYPREGKIRTVALGPMKSEGEVRVGAVPIDLAFATGSTVLTARRLAVADPSAKKVWLIEGSQSTLEAFGRGFLRALLGLGLFGGRSSQFPTGVDRVITRGSEWLAYDSSSETLYRFSKSNSSVVAKDVAPTGFALTADGLAYWHNGTLVAQKGGR